ncbi:MAG: hypothetical protein ABSG86_17625 [Thermoguttaceae bacterium]|jgi:hypothetical protein
MSAHFLTSTEIDVIVGRRAGKDDSGREQRGARRYAFPTSQFVAPCESQTPDTLPVFYPARFRDVSTRGISFYWPKEPTFEKVVLLMSGRNMAITALAEVVRCTRTAKAADDEYLVGCRLVKVLSKGALP